MENNIKVNIRNFRAVGKADILLNGISVITGENGCGKSSISKLVFHFFKTSIEFDQIVDNKVSSELREILRLVDNLTFELSNFIDSEDLKNFRYSFRRIYYHNPSQIDLFPTHVTNGIDVLIKAISNVAKIPNTTVINSRIARINRILKDTLEMDSNSDEHELKTLLKKIKLKIENNYKEAAQVKEKRPISILYESIKDAFNEGILPKSFNVEEYGLSLIDKKAKTLIPLHSIKNIAYIDTPMVVGLEYSSSRSHWNHLNSLLKQKGKGASRKDIDSIFKNEIIKGEVFHNEDHDFIEDDFIYLREDGSEFNLLECATGLKSFAILQILYKNGFLNKNTLLIIDEPEVHLHPQWVVEYARLIVLLYKKLGVKFLIASHHPDMISAIRYISAKEQIDESLNFYLAKKQSESYSYTYQHLGNDIEQIFASFNIALERIDQYGKTN